MKPLDIIMRTLSNDIVLITALEMKNISIITALLLLSIILTAQTTLVSYDLSSNGSGVDAQYVTSTAFTSFNTGLITFGSTGAWANGWGTTAVLNEYFEITVAPQSGYMLNITDVEFGERRSSTGIRDYQVVYSTDNFASQTVIATVNVSDNELERTGDITNLNITVNDGDVIKIRWYGYNAEASGGTWRINNSTLNVKGGVSNATSNDMDSKAEDPTTQIGAVSIPSTAQSIAAAVDVFKFKITDEGTTDGKPTLVTKIKIKKNSGSQLLDDWIQGFRLMDGITPISIASIVEDGSGAFFEININSGDIIVADGTSKELTLGVYLENEVVDNSDFSFYIDADDNGFYSDALGSGFASNFGSDIYSATISITVDATKMIYQQQSSTTPITIVMSPSPSIAYVDADNNIDEDIAGVSYAVSISSTGTLDGSSTTSMSPIAGIATFANIIHSFVGSGIYLTAASSHPSFIAVNSNTFNITLSTNNPAVDSLYISEVSDATNHPSEFLELYNPSYYPIDLSSVTLNRMTSSGAHEYSLACATMLGDHIIAPQSYLVISRGSDRTTFEAEWPSFPASAAFLQGNDFLYFGTPTSRRWSITYDDGSKAIILIDDTQTGVGGSNNTSNQLTKGSWTNYAAPANSTPGYLNPNSALPIELVQFEAKVVEGKVMLSWQTASEQNNDFFTLERSYDAQSFEPLIRVVGAGNSNIIQNYNYTDWIDEPKTTLYYRLKQTDYDGNYAYSDLRMVALLLSDFQLNKYFHTGDQLNMEITSPEISICQLEIYGMNAQLWYTQELDLGKGMQQYSCPLGGIPRGLYIMRLKTKSNTIVRRFVVE